MTIARTSRGDIEVNDSDFFLGPRDNVAIAFRVGDLELCKFGTARGIEGVKWNGPNGRCKQQTHTN